MEVVFYCSIVLSCYFGVLCCSFGVGGSPAVVHFDGVILNPSARVN